MGPAERPTNNFVPGQTGLLRADQPVTTVRFTTPIHCAEVAVVFVRLGCSAL